ncbi:hypothetical protein [Lactococcus garvieae]|uniref:hypothetical protein n=1 Tax=Lactococcus garvieae TaxID=1363 RepID=UPI003852B456
MTGLLLVIICPIFSKADYPQSQKIYRLYNSRNMEHLYTSDSNEYRQLPQLSKDWKQEGNSWASPLQGDKVYRVYNPESGEHIYTEDQNEVHVLTIQNGWKQEGIAFFSATNQDCPVYRLFNPRAGIGAHFVTMDRYEKENLVKQGWKYEGIAWYALPKDGSTPMLNLPLTGPKTAYISGNVKLQGSGTGYQAKFAINGTGEHAISFGVQVDSASSFKAGAAAGQAVYMSENINGSSHIYTAYGPIAVLGDWVHLELAYYSNSEAVGFFVDNQLVGTAHAPDFKNNRVITPDGEYLIANVDGSARINGDKVNAQFNNVNTSEKGMTAWNDTDNDWAGLDAQWTNSDLENSDFIVSGTSNLPWGLDWDTYWKAGFPTADGVAQVSLKIK